MKSSIWLKVETIGLCLGVLSTSLFILVNILGLSLFGLNQAFLKGGEPFAMFLATCIIFGLISCVLFSINLLFKRRANLWLRFLFVLIFLLSIAFIGNSLGI